MFAELCVDNWINSMNVPSPCLKCSGHSFRLLRYRVTNTDKDSAIIELTFVCVCVWLCDSNRTVWRCMLGCRGIIIITSQQSSPFQWHIFYGSHWQSSAQGGKADSLPEVSLGSWSLLLFRSSKSTCWVLLAPYLGMIKWEQVFHIPNHSR